MIGNDFLAAQIYKIISIARTHFFDHTSNEIGLTSKSLFVETPFLLDQVNMFFAELAVGSPGSGRKGQERKIPCRPCMQRPEVVEVPILGCSLQCQTWLENLRTKWRFEWENHGTPPINGG